MKLVSLITRVFCVCLILMSIGVIGAAQEDVKYQLPPKEIADLVDAPRSPILMLSSDSKTALLIEAPELPSIKVLAQPELKLAGLRINPRTNGLSSSMARVFKKMVLKDMQSLKEYPITGLPEEPQISSPRWSPDSRKIAFLLTGSDGIELWYVNVIDGKAEKLTDAVVNNAMGGGGFEWLSDSQRLLFISVLKDRQKLPAKDMAPTGPVVQSNEGKVAPVRTFQDLLTDKYDEEAFTYYTTAQLMMVDLSGKAKTIGTPGIIADFASSPDGNYVLVTMIKPPFSYLLTLDYFPQTVEIWDMDGKLVKQIADLPLADDIPTLNDAARKGPRDFTWRSDASAVLYWVEAQDDGNPLKEVEKRDKMYYLEAPFTGKTSEGPSLKYRFGGVTWGTGKIAMVRHNWWKTRKIVTEMFQPDFPGKPIRVIFDRSMEDSYTDPGSFVSDKNKYGQNVLLTDKAGRALYLRGRGASPEGDRPFIDTFDIETGKTARLWRSQAPFYESPVAMVDIEKLLIITSREGVKIQPNYYIRDLKKGKLKQLTFFPHPYPTLKDVEKQLIKYKRPDGVELSGNLYLPIGYKKTDGPLPVIMWAYPSEFKTKSAAGQVSDSPYRFIRVSYGSPLLWIIKGYAVFDDPSMPIVGEGNQEPNDTYIEQLVADAKAAIDTLAEMGVGDPKRVAIGGHSYGAFMTANLLAHSRLFAAGLARSGAYNRTLTPYGFQSEERDLWQAPETYIKMSPFMYADKIKDPILLIHGQNDNNSGTFPIQSERFFQALKGKGAIARLVLLPNESHGYFARESVMHVLWETYNWLEKYVRNKK